jgi:transposase
MSYPKELRERAVKYRKTHSLKETCEVFEVSSNAIRTWKIKLKESGSLENKVLNRKQRKIDLEKLRKDVEEHPDDFNRERALRFDCGGEAIRLALNKLGITGKKTFYYKERDEWKREEFLEKVALVPDDKRVYIDECGILKEYMRLYGYGPSNERVFDEKSGSGRKCHNIIGALCDGKLLALEVYKHSTNSLSFEAWFKSLLKHLPLGSTVILDNASFHRKTYLENIIKDSELNINILFLPPYGPDFNPIEQSWANLKNFLRKDRDDCVLSSIANYFFKIA